MKNYKKFAVALTAMFTLTSLNASSGVFNFETLDGAAKEFIEGVGNGNTSTQGTPSWTGATNGAMVWDTYSTSGAYGYLSSGNWHGGMVSNSQANTGTNLENDLNTVVGGGSGGSSNFGVMFLYDMMGQAMGTPASSGITITADGMTFNSLWSHGISDVESFSFITEDALNFTSIDLALNVYTYDNLKNGDGMCFDQVGFYPKTIENTPNSAYIIRIYGVDSNMEVITDNYIDCVLAYNYGDEVLIKSDWNTVSLDGLCNGEAINGLAFEMYSSFDNGYGPSTAAMVAIDNIAYATAAVPEPAEWAAIFGAIALVFVVSRKRVKK